MKTLCSCVVVSLLMASLSSCDNAGKTNAESTRDSVANVVDPETPAAADQIDSENVADEPAATAVGSEVQAIAQVWKSRPLNVAAGASTPGIKQFALAFCNRYGDYKACSALTGYLTKKASDPAFHIEDKARQGYIACRSMAQYPRDLICCFWNCNDGHQLVAFWLDEAYENGESYHLPAFYDYDPASGVMSPRPELTAKVESRMKAFDDYSVVLPDVGKDIVLTGYKIDAVNDCAENTELRLRWNGNGFDF